MSGFGTEPFGVAPFGAEASGADGPIVDVVSSAMATTDALDTEVRQITLLVSTLVGTDATAVEHIHVAIMVQTLALAGVIRVEEVPYLVEALQLDDTAAALAMRSSAVGEALRLNSTFTVILSAVVSDTAVLNAVLAGDRLATIALLDTVRALDAAATSVNAMAALADVLALREVLRSVHESVLADEAALAAALTAQALAMQHVVVNAVFADDLAGAAVLTVTVPEALALADESVGTALRLATLVDNAAITVSLTLDGIPYLGLALNTDSRGMTEYSGYDYNSLASFNGRLYGAGEAGLYRLDGTDGDEAVDAYLRTGLLQLGGGRQARVPEAYLGYRSDGTLQLKVITTGPAGTRGTPGKKVAHIYELREQTAEANRPGRIKVGRGLKSAYWAFELANVDGADFDVDVLAIHPLILDRRLP